MTGLFALASVERDKANRAEARAQNELENTKRAEARAKSELEKANSSRGSDNERHAPEREDRAERDPRQISVLFATNREINQEEDKDVLFDQITSNRSPELRYGTAVVRIPEYHQIGQVERPWELVIFGLTLWRTRENMKEHFTLKSVRTLPRSAVVDLLRKNKERGAMIFVHGFNVSFSDAVYKTAQIAYDAHFPGIPITFSWPSRAHVIDYDYDRESATFSRQAFLALLHLIENDGETTKVFVVAHSMGNQIVLDALANAQGLGIRVTLNEIIMAAPDVDRDVFSSLIGQVKSVSNGLTLYASSADRALVASRIKAGGIPRAGDVPEAGPLLASGMDSIDVTALGNDLFGINHDGFAKNRSLINDVGRLLLQGTRPPNVRTPELLSLPETPPTKYWKFAN
jgi:esterase/lipase superfamily enzyme